MPTMRIRLKAGYVAASPDGVIRGGQEATVDEVIGSEMVLEGYAEEVDAPAPAAAPAETATIPPPPVTPAPVETAAVAPPETATAPAPSPPRKPRRG